MHAVLFSGGRDSTLATAQLLDRGESITALIFDTGLSFGPRLSSERIRELRARYGNDKVRCEHLMAIGLVRRLALLDIENDILQDRYNLVLLGEMLALIAESIVFCVLHEIDSITAGFAGYQSDFPEQRQVAIEFFSEICETYGIGFATPLMGMLSESEVKEELWARNLSPKSLETSSLFAESGSSPTDEAVSHYLGRKKPAVRKHVNARLGI